MRTPRVSETEPRTRVRKSGDRRSRVRRRAKKNGAGAGLGPAFRRQVESRGKSFVAISQDESPLRQFRAKYRGGKSTSCLPPGRCGTSFPASLRTAPRPLADERGSSPRPRRDAAVTASRSEQFERTARRPPPRARSARAPSGNFGDVRRRLVPALLLRLRARTARGGDSGSGAGLASRSFACRGRPARAREARGRPPRRAGRRRGVRRGPPGRTDGAPGAGARGCASVAACASPDFRRGRRARCTAAR